MRAVVVYESMFGNTHRIAEAIADGMSEVMPVSVISVGDAGAAELDGVDVIVVGGPTHVHGMSVARTRAEARRMAGASQGELELDAETDADASAIGVREWLDALPRSGVMAAAFDTRTDIPVFFSGAASGRIDHATRRRGLRVVTAPMSFLVDSSTQLEPSEPARARAWGIDVAHAALSWDAAGAAAGR